MRLILERFAYHPAGTLGYLHLPGRRLFTVEQAWRDNQPNISCIPEGSYRCVPVKSPRFGATYEVGHVPGRSHILLHAANWPSQLEGCIAPGIQLADPRTLRDAPDPLGVMQSRVAMAHINACVLGQRYFELVVRGWRPDYH